MRSAGDLRSVAFRIQNAAFVIAVSGDARTADFLISVRHELRGEFIHALSRADVERDVRIPTRTAVHRARDRVVMP